MIKNLLLKLNFFMLLVFSFVIQNSIAISADEIYISGAPENFPPLFMKNPDGTAGGFGMEVFDAVMKNAGLKYKHKQFATWKEVVEAWNKGEIDIMPNAGISKDRRETYYFTIPIHTFKIVYFVRKDYVHKNNSESNMDGMAVGVSPTNIAAKLLKNNKSVKLVYLDDEHNLLIHLLAGNLDAVAYPEEVIKKLAYSLKLEERIKVFGEPVVEVKRAIAVSNKHVELVRKLNVEVLKFLETDEYKRIYTKYYGTSRHEVNIYTILYIAFISVVIASSLMIMVHIMSLKKINKKLSESLAETENAKRELEENQNRMKLITDTMRDVFWICSRDMTKVIYLSPAFEDVWGIKVEDLYENPSLFLNSIHPDDRDGITKDIYSEENENWKLSYRIVRPDGHIKYISDIGFPYKDDNGKVIYMVGIARDVTNEVIALQENKKNEQIMIQQSRFAAMGEMISAIAHQWRQPLNALGLIIQAIEEEVLHSEKLDKQELKELKTKAMELVVHMSSTITDFKSFFAPSKNVEKFNLIKIIADTYNLVSEQLEALNISFKLSCRCREGFFESDNNNKDTMKEGCLKCKSYLAGYPGEFKQVLLNLIQNSKDAYMNYPKDNMYINFNVSVLSDSCTIEVNDNAGGINNEIIDKVFDPYFSTKGPDGTGIGLYMAKTIITSHFDGHIHLENRNGGASVVIILPLNYADESYD